MPLGSSEQTVDSIHGVLELAATEVGMDSEIVGEGTTKEQQCGLQHQRQKLHHVVKIPRNDAVEFALPVLTAFYCSSSHVG